MEMLRFGKVKSFVSGLLTKSVGVEIEADAGEPSAKDSELWAHAPLLYAPAAPSATDAVSDAEHCEALFYQLGDERVVIATKDRRWQISVGEGEVVLRAIGPGAPAYVHLKPDGSASIHATSINLGGTATHFVALSNLVLAELNKLWAAIETHTHPVAGATAGPTVAKATAAAAAGLWSGAVAVNSASSVAATKTKAE